MSEELAISERPVCLECRTGIKRGEMALCQRHASVDALERERDALRGALAIFQQAILELVLALPQGEALADYCTVLDLAEEADLSARAALAGTQSDAPNWRDVLKECADELELQIQFGCSRINDPSDRRAKFDRDMKPVLAARALLGQPAALAQEKKG